ncbi:hypothetical protein GI482_16965 [Bacillus sp. N3536]|nr:hypothetical protein GI482_16965 [Bacillus sp. N3536]
MTEQTKIKAKETATEQVQVPENLQVLQSIIAKNKIKSFQNINSGRGGFISIVKSTNGTRFTISKQVNEKLGYPSELFVGFEDDYLIIFNAEGTDASNIKLRKNDKRKLTIYNTGLVNLIINEFELDYTDKTSRSFTDGHFKEQGRPVLYVKMV